VNSKYFNIDDLDPDEITEQSLDKSGALLEKFLSIHCVKIKSIKELIGKAPEPEHIIFIWTINSFNAYTIIPFTIKEFGKIDELIISTYSINIRIIDALIKDIDTGKITTVVLFISETLKSRLPKVFDHLATMSESRKNIIKVIYCWNHSKIACIRSGDKYFIFEGSGNFSENAQHEQYTFLQSQKVFEFRKHEIMYGIKS
jgi:hypothetical protein